MKNHKTLFAILPLAISWATATESQLKNSEFISTNSAVTMVAGKDSVKPRESTKNSSPKSGYEMDGTTSASKLVAKRSHSVSKEDETGLAIFLGLIVIGLIVFFLKPFSEKK